MTSFEPTALPNSEHVQQINKGTLMFSYTCVGLTSTMLFFVILFFCYKIHTRASVAATAAETDTGGHGHRCVDLAKLPEFAYTGSHSSSNGDGAQCSVCLGTLHFGEIVRMLPLCKHLYHVECIDMWLASHETCPLCRADVELPEAAGKPVMTAELPV
ncbi:hypothetical protein ACQ4PT_007660 [Festuca glaucescens]